MAVDAGTIWASIRIRLDKLNADVTSATKSMDRMAGAINNSGKAVENLNKLGTKMSLMVTAPLVAAGAAAVKFASDEGEALNAANVVFRESANVITAWGENAATQAGLSKAEFFQSAAVTGAMLKGMNLTIEESADKTIMLTKRAADMASIFNTDVKDSTNAVAAAIRGEMEPIRRYGITLNQAMIQAKALAMGLYDGKGQIDSYAKAQATMALIMEQTNDIANDFVNTSDQQQNATRILVAETKNQAAALGKELLPYALQLIQGLRKLVDGFGNMTDEQKKTIVKVAALAAGLGPLTIGISKTIQAVTLLKGALVALSANPIGLAIAGVMALGYGLQKLGDMNNQRMLKEVGEQFGDMADEANLTAQKISDIQEAIALSGKGGFNFDTVSEQAAMITQELGITYDQLNRIAQTSDKVSQEYKDTLAMVTSIKEQERLRYQYTYGSAAFAEKFSGETRKTVEAMKESAPATVSEQIRGRIEAEKEYQQALKTAKDLRRLQAIDDAELRELQIGAAEDYRDTLVDLGYASENELGTKGQDALTQMIALLKELGAGSTTFNNLINKVNALDTETAKTSASMRASLIKELEAARDYIGEDVFQDLTDKVNAYYDKLQEKEAAEQFKQNMEMALDSANQMFSALSSLVDAVYEKKLERLEQDMEKELEANGLAEESAVERAERELEIAKDSGDQEAISTAQSALKKAKIEEEYNKKRAELQYEAEMKGWQLDVLSSQAMAALSILRAFSSVPYPYNIVAGSVMSAIASIQTAAVLAAKPVKNYQTGGIVRATGGGQVGRLAENGYDEYLFNMGPGGQSFARQQATMIAEYLIASGVFNKVINFTVEVDRVALAKIIAPVFEDGQVRLKI